MFINLKPAALLSILGLTSFSCAQVVVNQLVGYATSNGGTTSSGTQVTVNTCAALSTALQSTSSGMVRINGVITGCGVIDVGSNKSIFGVGTAAVLIGVTLRIKDQHNVVIRNISFKRPPPEEDSITIQASTNVWVDHCSFESDIDHGQDYYDGLIDITHGSDWITISWCKFLNHYKASLVGHSDSNGDEDIGKLHVTYHHNYWNNIGSRTPSFRFGTGHIYSSCYLNIFESGINSRMGAELLIEQCYFENTEYCIATNLYSTDEGYVQEIGNVYAPDTRSISQTTLVPVPYSYTATLASQVCALTLTYAGVGVVINLP